MKPEKAYGRDLEFIARIMPEGESIPHRPERCPGLDSTQFELRALSITLGTYIASGFTTHVVRFLPGIHRPQNNWELAQMVLDGKTCKVESKYIAEVIDAMNYHHLSVSLEVDGDTVTITPKR